MRGPGSIGPPQNHCDQSSGTFTEYYPLVGSFVTFRHSGRMTVPGKGGRPRKGRSDADRVRAYRARQRDLPEPPTVVEAIEDGDELATAWDTIRRLGLQLDEAQQGAESLRRELKRTHGELERERARYGWIEANNDSQRFELERVTAERSTLADDNRTLAQRLRVLESGTRPPAKLSSPPANATLPRATRRKLERERHRSKPSLPPAP